MTEIADFVREEKGTLSIAPMLQSDMISKDTKFKIIYKEAEYHKPPDRDDSPPPPTPSPDQKDRMRSKPNIQNMPRDHQEIDMVGWEQCRIAEKENGFRLCDSCYERFKCWTAGRPERIRFLFDELDTKQIQFRMYEIMKRKYDEDVLKIFGTSSKNLPQR